jgi:hypothetical protein
LCFTPTPLFVWKPDSFSSTATPAKRFAATTHAQNKVHFRYGERALPVKEIFSLSLFCFAFFVPKSIFDTFCLSA